MPLDFIGYSVVTAHDADSDDRFLLFYDAASGVLTHRARLKKAVAEEVAHGLLERPELEPAQLNGDGAHEEQDQRVRVREDDPSTIGELERHLEDAVEKRPPRAIDRLSDPGLGDGRHDQGYSGA